MEANLPNNWKARDYQRPVCDYLDAGGKHAELIWHRRAGKDDVCLHHAACQMNDRAATYWHMLPLANQVRKAIWEAVNPHTGIRRILEAFPRTLFDHRESDMMVKYKHNASTWQCLGSDNYEGAIGSPPAGIVYSEWAQANPSARGYLRPILAENNGYQIYITTPRGKNHAYNTYNAALKEHGAFAQKLTIDDTGVLTPEQLDVELEEYISTYGEDMGNALFQQEYYCSFDAAILGAYYGSEFAAIDKQHRICSVPHDENFPVYVAMDIGRTDDTAIYWAQFIGGEVRLIDYYINHGMDPAHYCEQILGKKVELDLINGNLVVNYGPSIPGLEHRREYSYKKIHMPHDAKTKTFATLKSGFEQFVAVFGWSGVSIVPMLSLQHGIDSVRLMFPRLFIDERVDEAGGVEPLRQYQREWDDTKKMFKNEPLHDWCSHPADAFRYLAVAWLEEKPKDKAAPLKFPAQGTFNDMLNIVKKRRVGSE